MPKRNTQEPSHAIIDYQTGVIRDIIKRERITKSEYFIMMLLEQAEKLAKEKDLTGTDYKVLLFLISRMEFGKDVRAAQSFIATSLGIRAEQVSLSIKKLIKADVVSKTTVDGQTAYSIHVATMGKAKG